MARVTATPRLSAAERREDVLDAAMIEFAERGLEGTSTEDIARRAGISQPYLFRLFGTKKELFKATATRCLRETLELFQRAAEGKRGEEALKAMGQAYRDQLILSDGVRLRAQMQTYAACDDPEISRIVRDGYGDLVAYVQRVSGLPDEDVARFFAIGMFMNVLASMHAIENPESWSQQMLAGLGKDDL
jgi:AcrR family transcriptional regulator